MANKFWREANPSGDDNAWAQYVMAQDAAARGVLSAYLYNDGGALKLSAGMVGIDDGTVKGVCKIDTAITVSLAACSNSTWLKVELTVSGTAVTVTAADIAAATDPTTLPSAFKNAYDGAKGAFHISASKRCVGLAWKDSGGALLAVVNTVGGRKDWWASDIGGHLQQGPGRGFAISLGAWNMDTTLGKTVNHALGVFYAGVVGAMLQIRRDDNVYYHVPLNYAGINTKAGTPDPIPDAAEPLSATAFYIWRDAGTDYFDSALFDDAGVRGNLTFRMLDF